MTTRVPHAVKFETWRQIHGIIYPIPSMYGIFTNIHHKNQPDVDKYTIHGLYGYSK